MKLIIKIIKSGCAGTGGFFMTTHEIAGPFSGLFIGIQNMIATIPGFVAPYVVSLITVNVIVIYYF